MSRFFIEITYDGTGFHGSQLQGNTPTVQLAVNTALSTILREPILSYGSSRTDEGVHALCNFYHFDTNTELPPDFKYKLNALLPHTISVKRVFTSSDPEFNARFDAISRQYRYRIYYKKDPFLYQRALFYPFKIDRDILDQTASIIKEYDHFESFSKRNTQSKTFTCRIIDSHWEQQGDELHYVVEANRFLRGMVRGLVGTQLQAARGIFDMYYFRHIVEAKDCTLAYFNVAGFGLYLENICYPEGKLTEVVNIR